MSFAYYASRLSDNMGETPEGYLVCADAVIARTGWQTYQVGELPADALKELGIDTSNPSASVEVYRSPEEVFSSATIASFEGKSVTDNHPPAEQFVDPDTITQYEYGHAQNVRKGKEPLESGEWPLIADLIIKREPLLSKVRESRLRETSCGYDYALALDGDKLCQTNIRGNHVAVVPRGRAGAEARIKDAVPEKSERQTAGSGSAGTPRKEVRVTNILKHIFGLGLQAYAKDAEPEKLAEAAEAIKKEGKADEPDKKADDKRADDRKADDRRADDRKADDRRADDKKADDCKADDRHADDKRARFHAMLDRMLDESDERADDNRADDADLEELRDLFDEFFEGEEGESGNEGEGSEGEGEVPSADAVARDMEGFEDENGFHPIRGSEGYKRGKAGEGRRKRRAHDSTLIEPVAETQSADKTPGALEVLQALRPVVARSNDAALRRAFNAQLGRFTRSSKSSDASYSRFAGATRQRAADATAGGHQEPDSNQKLQTAYDAIRSGKPISKEDK